MNSSVAAGAGPIPSSSKTMTRGISNSSGTLISTPTVAAMSTAVKVFPRCCSTVAGLSHWITRPLTRPAPTMMGASRRAYRKLALIQFLNASASGGSSVSSPATPTSGSPSARLASRWAAQATRGPSANPPSNATVRRLMPRAGPNTKKVMASAGMFSVAEPCTTATAPPIPPPPRRYAVEMGTMHAEHRFSTGPIARPLAVRAIAPLGGLGALEPGNRNVSARPATRKANTMPTATSPRYVL